MVFKKREQMSSLSIIIAKNCGNFKKKLSNLEADKYSLRFMT
jgi:hypothetical protein